MSEPTDINTSHSLALYRQLQETTAQFAEKERQLIRELRSGNHSESQAHTLAVENIQSQLNQQLAEVNADFDDAETAAREVYETRRKRIKKAHNDILRDLPQNSKKAKEKWLGEIQMRKFLADRKRTADTRTIDKQQQQSSDALQEQNERVAALQKRAHKAFEGYWRFLKSLRETADTPPTPDQTNDLSPEASLDRLRSAGDTVEERLEVFRRHPLPRFFAAIPIPIVVVGILICVFLLALIMQSGLTGYLVAAAAAVVALLATGAVHFVGRQNSSGDARQLMDALAEARNAGVTAQQSIERHHQSGADAIAIEHDEIYAEVLVEWEKADTIEVDFEKHILEKVTTQVPVVTARNEGQLENRLATLAAARKTRLETLNASSEAQINALTDEHDQSTAEHAATTSARWSELEAEWHAAIDPLWEEMAQLNVAAGSLTPEWTREFVDSWSAPDRLTDGTRFASLSLDLSQLPHPADPRLPLPGNPRVSLPLALTFPDHASLLIESDRAAGSALAGVFNNIILRLLTSAPAGKVNFTILDPVGLGENFAGLMHLADHEETLINRRIWTQREQIDARLDELNEQVEKIIQMYLRNEYATIAEYNQQAGSTAEKYHVLVVADFPANFSENAARRLVSLATSGPRCGIYTLLHWNTSQALPDGFQPDEVRANSICLTQEGNTFSVAPDSVPLAFDSPPASELAIDLVNKIGQASIDSNRVEVPFKEITPATEDFWTGETTAELRIPVGRTGATKLQYLAIGKGTRQHTLVAGKTGSGKSTLFHVIITNLALAFSPREVQFYLIDFKKGVEFKCYAERKLPHARVIAIESDREFGLSVLQRVDDELKRRGDMFRKLGVQDIAGYKREGGTEPVPRTLLMIDEFQEFFVEDDSIAQTASMLFDRIVRQGRAFGIHVILGSQTLGGAYTLARTTLGQMVIRIALQCNEADAYLIMDDNNPAPRLLSRPGEGIYNDAAGALEGNSPFQVVWLPDEERDRWLDKVVDLSKTHQDIPSAEPIVFEGNTPADVHDNSELAVALASTPKVAPGLAHAWLGAPNSIKGPTRISFQPQSGSHLLVVGQRDEGALTLLGLSVIALASQHPPEGAKFYFFHNTAPGSIEEEFVAGVAASMPHDIRVARGTGVEKALGEVAGILGERTEEEASGTVHAPVFVCIHGLQRFKKFKQSDDFDFSVSDSDGAASPSDQLNDLICEGSAHGIHVLASLDTFNNVNRFLSRKALSEFELRVVFQMSANDSASLIDSPKANDLGLHRALLYNEQEGYLETFRPYAMPDKAWLEKLSPPATS